MARLDHLRHALYRGPRRRLAFERYLRAVERAPWADPVALDRCRAATLQSLLTRAVPGVAALDRRLRHAGVEASDVRSIDDLQAIPPVTKAELRAMPREDLVNENARAVMWLGTSGSSGSPFSFAVDPFFHSRSDAVRAYVYGRCGFRRGVAVEMYAARGRSPERDPGVGRIRRHIVDYGLPAEDRATTIVAIGPHLLYGNRSHLLELADELERRNVTLPRLTHLISSSEPLGGDDRQRLRAVFGVEPRDLYGLAELSSLCFEESPGRGYRVVEPRAIVEVLCDGRPARPGETGEIVVTSLDNAVMPFIRYATGDLAVLGADSSPSGHAGMAIERIEGRAVDTIRRLDGTPVTYWALGTSATWSNPAVAGRVRQWQVVQSSDRGIDVLVAPGELGLDDGAKRHIADSIASAVGPGFGVDVVAVDTIPLEANGKFKPVKISGDGASRTGPPEGGAASPTESSVVAHGGDRLSGPAGSGPGARQ